MNTGLITLETLGLIFVLAFAGLMLVVALFGRKRPARRLRDIPAFAKLNRAVGLAVEAGNRLHMSLGRGQLLSQQSAVGFVGLSLLDRIARWTSFSDQPPIATSGEGTLSALSQDTLQKAARSVGADFDPTRGRLAGITPFSYAAGVMPVIQDEGVGANMLIGSFGSEVALINEAGERAGSLTLAGTDDLSGQAILFATAQEPLIGEETYAGGAYLGASGLHAASLVAQDVFRWVIIALILISVVLKLAGVL